MIKKTAVFLITAFFAPCIFAAGAESALNSMKVFYAEADSNISRLSPSPKDIEGVKQVIPGVQLLEYPTDSVYPSKYRIIAGSDTAQGPFGYPGQADEIFRKVKNGIYNPKDKKPGAHILFKLPSFSYNTEHKEREGCVVGFKTTFHNYMVIVKSEQFAIELERTVSDIIRLYEVHHKDFFANQDNYSVTEVKEERHPVTRLKEFFNYSYSEKNLGFYSFIYEFRRAYREGQFPYHPLHEKIAKRIDLFREYAERDFVYHAYDTVRFDMHVSPVECFRRNGGHYLNVKGATYKFLHLAFMNSEDLVIENRDHRIGKGVYPFTPTFIMGVYPNDWNVNYDWDIVAGHPYHSIVFHSIDPNAKGKLTEKLNFDENKNGFYSEDLFF